MELKLDRNKTYGLALEGGGAKGAYQIGAWKALREAGIRFSAVSGTSVGALNGAMIVMDDLEKAEKILLNEEGIAPLYYKTEAWLVRPDIKGIVYNGAGLNYNFKEAYVSGN